MQKYKYSEILKIIVLATILFGIGMNTVSQAQQSDLRCELFDDIPLGTTLTVGDQFLSAGYTVEIGPFEKSPGQIVSHGTTEIIGVSTSGMPGHQAWTNNSTIRFQFHNGMNGLSLQYADFGGHINIEINGDFISINDIPDINGLAIGGVTAQVRGSVTGGTLVLNGPIFEFSIGGEEFWIDGICQSCIEFEDLQVNDLFTFGQQFNSEGLDILVDEFQWSPGQTTQNGLVQVMSANLAGGTGQDLFISNANLRFNIPTDTTELTLLYGFHGGNNNILVNGEFVDFNDFNSLNQTVIGGVNINVNWRPNPPLGILKLQGPIQEFMIGGQELAIDRLCIVKEDLDVEY